MECSRVDVKWSKETDYLFTGSGGGTAHLQDVTLTFMGDSTVRLTGELRLYCYWDNDEGMFSRRDTFPEDFEFPMITLERAWYNPARWTDGKTYEVRKGGWYEVGTRSIDVIIPASLVNGIPARPRHQTITRDEVLFGDS